MTKANKTGGCAKCPRTFELENGKIPAHVKQSHGNTYTCPGGGKQPK